MNYVSNDKILSCIEASKISIVASEKKQLNIFIKYQINCLI